MPVPQPGSKRLVSSLTSGATASILASAAARPVAAAVSRTTGALRRSTLDETFRYCIAGLVHGCVQINEHDLQLLAFFVAANTCVVMLLPSCYLLKSLALHAFMIQQAYRLALHQQGLKSIEVCNSRMQCRSVQLHHVAGFLCMHHYNVKVVSTCRHSIEVVSTCRHGTHLCHATEYEVPCN